MLTLSQSDSRVEIDRPDCSTQAALFDPLQLLMLPVDVREPEAPKGMVQVPELLSPT